MSGFKRIALLASCLIGSSVSVGVETEYDFIILDPESAFGSPYGGYSRATASRLSSIPLKLPNFANGLSEFQPFYTTMRDAEGKEYACRVYHEDELEAKSIDDSMFEMAKLKIENEKTNEEDPTPDSYTIVHRDTEAEVVESKTVSRLDNPLYISRRLRERLKKLEGMCAQYHVGWWSYEWCYAEKVRQFHVHIDNDASKKNNIKIQDITSLGSFTERNMKVFHEDLEIESRPEEFTKNPNALGEVQDIYRQGAWCPQTKKPRITEATLRCCSPEKISKNRGSVLFEGKPLDTSLLAMVDIFEDSVCVYNVTMCTPILCSDYVDDSPKKNTLDESQKKNLMDKSAEQKALDASDVGDMTVIEILKTVFGRNQCIQSGAGGWWFYELCPGRHVRQFHEVTLLDRISGMPRTEVETEHILGKFNPDDDFVTREDEWKHVVNTTASSNGSQSKASAGKNSVKGNGAYYAQEYISGDLCEDEDVTDSAIKAGEFGEGGIERATTVRYSCGNQLEMNTKEDSTCHYIVDVSIPALCGHPFFKAPVSKQQVVKCLPVE